MRKIFLFFIPILFFTGVALADDVLAGTGENVSGFAWSENIGWVSFNCTNTGSCGSSDYGVDINDESGEFSGHAWSENIGWVSFNRSETGAPPAQPYQDGGLNYIAKANLDTGEVTGWARALSYGADWDGWVKLNDTSYGVSVNTSNGDFSGYGWSDEIVGWINFSGLNYKVTTALSFNRPPSAGIVEETWNHCSIQGRSIPVFSWTYSDSDGDPQAAYEIEVDSNSAFQAPKFNHVVNTGSTSYALDLSQDDNSDWISELSWNTTYFWRVKVKDSDGNWSDWTNSDQFKTPFHAYPWPDFNWAPAEPSQGEVVIFNPDASVLYGGTSVSSYLWTITQGEAVFVDETGTASRYPHIIFDTTDNQMRLRITDSDGYSCQTSTKTVTVHLPLPEYEEAPPSTWLNLILAIVDGALKSFFSFLTSWQKFATLTLR
ncbi:MAG: hypothetical protein HYT21_01880 [Candidatus Nealsonbacteria bacterium]|nr:hypothetical protein [Candidatus Nealsonbacteria bacterium]